MIFSSFTKWGFEEDPNAFDPGNVAPDPNESSPNGNGDLNLRVDLVTSLVSEEETNLS
jgi:hypothetical protein